MVITAVMAKCHTGSHKATEQALVPYPALSAWQWEHHSQGFIFFCSNSCCSCFTGLLAAHNKLQQPSGSCDVPGNGLFWAAWEQKVYKSGGVWLQHELYLRFSIPLVLFTHQLFLSWLRLFRLVCLNQKLICSLSPFKVAVLYLSILWRGLEEKHPGHRRRKWVQPHGGWWAPVAPPIGVKAHISCTTNP